MPKYLSGRSKRTSNERLPLDRYSYLSIGDAEPNPSDPKTIGLSEGASGPAIPGGTIPSGVRYQLVSVWDDPTPGKRYWQPVEGGLIPGAVTFYDKNIQISGSSSITQLDWYGIGVTFGISNIGSGSTDIRARIFVAPPGKVGQVLFNDTNANYGGSGAGRTDFSTSNDLLFNSNVGILTVGSGIHIGNDTVGFGSIFNAVGVGTSAMVGVGTINPTQNLHVVGNLRLTGTIYDGDNRGGNQGDLIIKAADDTLEWKSPNQVQAGAGGTISNIQYHDDTGLVEGAPNFVWIESTQRVGVGSTQPTVLLDVRGDSKFLGDLDVTGISTFTGDHKVTGVSTFVGLTSVIDGGFFADDVYVSAASTFVGVGTFGSDLSVAGTLSVVGITTLYNIKIDNNEIESLNGNLILDSQGGTTQINDVVYINDPTESTTTDNGSLFVNGGVGIDKNLNVGGGVSISGPAVGVAVTLAALGGITTTGGDLFIGGDLYVNDDIFLDEARVQHLIVNPGVATFHGNIHVFDSTVGIGTTGITFGGDTPHAPALLISGKDYNESTLALINNDTDNNGSYIFFGKQRSGEYGGSTILQNGDNIGQLRFLAADGTDLNSSAAAIEVQVDGTVGGNDTPGRIKFLTTPSGSNSPTERLRIDSKGNIGVNTENASDISSIFKGIQVNNSGYIWGQSQSEYPSVFLTNNARPTSGSFVNDWKRDLPGDYTSPVQLELYNGDFTIRTAASGAANSGITWDTRFIIKEEGNVQLKGGEQGHLQIDNNGEFELFEQDTSLTMTNSSKIAMDFDDNVARIRSSYNGSGVNAVARPLAFFMGASEKLRITGIGSVGIGTDNPDYGLHVYGAGDILVEDNANGSAHMRFRTSNNGADVSNWKIKTSADNHFYIENDTVGGTSQVTIDDSGKVGINETSPSGKLEVKAAGATAVFNSGAANDGRLEFEYNSSRVGLLAYHSDRLEIQTDSSKDFTIRTNGANERLRINSDGNVGIGTTNFEIPVTSNNEKVLAVGVVTAHSHYGNTFYGNIEGGITVTDDITIPDWITHKDNTQTKFGFPDNDTFSVETAGSERLRINSTGITTFFGEVFLESSGANRISMRHTSGGNAVIKNPSAANLSFGTNNKDNELTIQNGGDVGIGTDNPQQKLDVRGNVVIGKDQTTGNPGTTVGITTIRGHHVNSDSDYAQLYLSNSKSAGGGSAPTASIRAARESGNYGTNLTFWTNGTGSVGDGSERLRIDADGKVGIGYTRASNFLAGANNLVVGNGANNQGITIYSGSNASNYGSIYFADGTEGAALSRGQIRYEQNNEVMSFYTNNVERININIDGDLIPAANGTQDLGSDPTSSGKRWNKIWAKDIDITGDIDVTGDFNVDDLKVAGIATVHGELHALDNVGIGTTNPQADLDVKGEGRFLVDAFRYGTDSGVDEDRGIYFRRDFVGVSTYNLSIIAYDHTPGHKDGLSINAYDGVSFCTGSNTRQERLRITGDGDVGIGTNSPETLLDVYGDGANGEITVQRSGGASILTQAQASLGKFGTNSNHDLQLMAHNSSYLTITTSARVGVNTTDPNANLQVDYDEGNSQVGLRLRAYNATNSKTWQISEINGDAGTLHIRNQTDNKTVISIDSSGNVTPKDDAANQDLGGSGKRWNKVWAKDIDITGEVGLTGDVTIDDLYVTGIATFTQKILTSGNTQLFGSDTTDGSDTKAIMINGGGDLSDNRGGYLLVHGNEHSSNPGVTRLHAGNVGSAGIEFYTLGIEKLRIASDGNVGIGSTIPGQKLDVNGAIRLLGNNAPTYSTILKANYDADHTLSLNVHQNNQIAQEVIGTYADIGGGGANPRVAIAGNSGWKVGIGSTAPVAQLHVYRATQYADNPIIQARSNHGSSGQLKFEIDGDGTAYFNGNVGIGTNNPSDFLDVYKYSSTAYDATSDSAQRNVSASITIRNDDGTNNSFSQLVFDTGGTDQSIARIVALRTGSATNDLAFVTEHSNTKSEKLRITSEGHVGIGTTNPTALNINQALNTDGTKEIVLAVGIVTANKIFGEVEVSGVVDKAKDLEINATNQLVIQTANDTTDVLAAGTEHYVLTAGASNAAPTWVEKVKKAETADDAIQIRTIKEDNRSNAYLTFVHDNNTNNTYENLYTSTNIIVDSTPTTGGLKITGIVTATTFDGAFEGTLTGVADTANHVKVTDNESTNEDNLITFVADAATTTGNHALEMDGNLHYNPSSGTLTASNFSGTTTVATKVTVTDNESTAENNLIPFVADAATTTGDHGLEMDGDFHYNPSTGKLTVPSISGSVSGIATGADNLVSGETANFPKLVTQTEANTTAYLDHSANGNYILATNSDSTGFEWVAKPTGSISGITIKDEGSALANLATTLNFVGDGVVATNSGTTGEKTITIGGNVTGKTKYAILYDAKSQGTVGGTATAAQWNTRVLNTKVDPEGFVSMGGGSTGTDGTNTSFSLPAGSYKFEWRSPGFDSGAMRARLAYSEQSDFSSGVTYVVGETAWSNVVNENNDFAFGTANITITATTYFRIEFWLTSLHTTASASLGAASNVSGVEEIYTQVMVLDLATAVKDSSDSGIDRVAVIKDQKNAGVNGGSFVKGYWRDRDLTVIEDPTGFVNFTAGGSQSSESSGNTPGYWSLPAGNYEIEWSAPGWDVNRHQTRLVWSTTESDVTSAGDNNPGTASKYGANICEGSSENNSEGSPHTQTRSFGKKVITISTVTYFKILHISNYSDSKGFGSAIDDITNYDTKQIYTQVKITDLKTAVKESEIVNTGTTKVATVKDVKAYNVNGGKFPGQRWNPRDLNTVDDPQNIGVVVSAASSMAYVPAGTYKISWSAPATISNRHVTRLAYSTNSALNDAGQLSTDVNYVDGNTAYPHFDSLSQELSHGIAASLTFSATTYMQIQHFGTYGNMHAHETGFGVDSSEEGTDSVYTTIQIEDLATAVKDATGTTKCAILEDQKASNTNGGTFTSGAWRDRTLNSETDPQSFVTLDSGNVYFSLAAGTYEIDWSAPATMVDKHQTRLMFATDTGFSSNVGYVYGSSEMVDQNEAINADCTRSFGRAIKTITQTTYFKIQHRCTTTKADDGFGTPNNFTGDSQVEVYTQVVIKDLASAVKTTGDDYVSGNTKIARIYDEKTQNTDAGSPSGTGFENRTLNKKEDPYNFVTLDSGNVYFQLAAGSYKINWRAPGQDCNRFRTKLVYANNTDFNSSSEVLGESSKSDTTGGVEGQFYGCGTAILTITENTYFKIQQSLQTKGNWGIASNIGGPEIYTQVFVEDLKTAVKDSSDSGIVSNNNVWHVQKTDHQTIDNETWTDITGLSQTVTSTSADTKFLITATVNASMSNNSGHDGILRLMRGTTVIGSTSTESGSSANQTGFAQISGQDSYYTIDNGCITYLDTPGAGSHTYHIEGLNCHNESNMIVNGRTAGSFYMVSHMSIQRYT